MDTVKIVNKLWKYCDILRDDGVSYLEYVTELTYLLYLKMLNETQRDKNFPPKIKWSELIKKNGIDQYNFYRKMLIDLGNSDDHRTKLIYSNANTSINKPSNLNLLIKNIDTLDWYSAKVEGLGDLYEGLLEKNASEGKKGAGQYFTPRALIDIIIELINPKHGEIIHDPAAGTGGFLIAADRYIKKNTDDLFKLSQKEQKFQKTSAYVGIELVSAAHLLGLMNLTLHDIECTFINGDTLSNIGSNIQKSDVIITNPPFGNKKGGGEQELRDDLTFRSSNKQLNFLQHIYNNLKPGGRAAVVFPDNVLFVSNGKKIREDFFKKCILHTVLRLPFGIFYAAGIRTNVLFFERKISTEQKNENIWYYDLRTNHKNYSKTDPLTNDDLLDFKKSYSKNLKDRKENKLFKKISMTDIVKNNFDLDIQFIKEHEHNFEDETNSSSNLLKKIQKNLDEAKESLENV